MKRKLGDFAKGLEKQFDISTVLPVEEPVGGGGDGTFHSEWGQNFDNDEDHDGAEQ